MCIAVCDDCAEYVKVIEEYFDKIRKKVKNFDCDIFADGAEIVSLYEKETVDYDVVFLDMEMERMNGIETANAIRKYDKHVLIVFATSHAKYMQESFQCLPFRFLIKPVTFENVEKTIGEVMEKLSEGYETLVFESNRTRTRLFCEDIIYFESHSHNVRVYTVDETHRFIKPLDALINMLGNKMFFRTHKSYIVNCKYVKQVLDKEIVLYNTEARINRFVFVLVLGQLSATLSMLAAMIKSYIKVGELYETRTLLFYIL